MDQRSVARLLKPFGQIRQEEVKTALLMFLYSFLVMTAYTIIKPATRSMFIGIHGPDNLPYVQFTAAVVIGFVMAVYSWMMTRLPRRWSFVIVQGEITFLLIAFWFLFLSGQKWVATAFYLVGLILGLLLISQFWTLANLVFNPRQAKRLFGFIGGGASLGGILGSSLATAFPEQTGTEALILFGAGFMGLSIIVVAAIIRRENLGTEAQESLAAVEKGVGGKKAVQLLRQSSQLRLIALVISFAAIGAAIIDQQLNMAVAEDKGNQATVAITVFLANVQFWTSVVGFLVQVFLTSRIHRHLGIGFALLMLPVSLGSTGMVVLLNATLWAPAFASILDKSLRYTVDKTTREVLYMPLPSDIKFMAKPFVDVTVERFARGLAAVLLLFLIQPWGMGLTWQKLSCASIVMMGIWIFMALRARNGYRQSFRKSIHTREIKPEEAPDAVADLETIEILIQELSSPDTNRVLYAIEFLESLNKRQLITPLLLFHESPIVRARALSGISALQPEISARWLPAIRSMMTDPDSNVRSTAVGALASIGTPQVHDLIRPLLDDQNPRIALTAAMVLAGSSRQEDAESAGDVLTRLMADKSDSAVPIRRDFAIAIRQVPVPHYRRLLIPLLNDSNSEIVDEAMHSIIKIGSTDVLFIPTFISMLRNRHQKNSVRALLVGYGDMALPILDHFLKDPVEDIRVRRNIPEVIAHIPCQRAMDILIEALDVRDGSLRFHVIAALEKIHRSNPDLSLNHHRIEMLIHDECVHYKQYHRPHRYLFESQQYPKDSLIACVLVEKMRREVDRIYRLLGLIYPWEDIIASRKTIEQGDARSRAHTLEYLDNTLAGNLRKSLIPLLEDIHQVESSFLLNPTKSDVESSILQLIRDEDPVVASAAIYFVWQQKLSNLVGKIKQVKMTLDIKDQHELETVAWVLQEFSASDSGKRMSGIEILPSVFLVDRLHHLPLFGEATVDEIFRICDTGQQVHYGSGQILYRDSQVPETVQFLLEGSVEFTQSSMETRLVEAPAVLALQEVLEKQPIAESVRTIDKAVCLVLTSGEILTLLAENNHLVPGLFQTLRMHSPGERVLVKGNQSQHPAKMLDGNLSPIEKGLVLKAIPFFSQVSPDEIMSFAATADEISIKAGKELIRKGDSPATFTLVSGILSIERNAESVLTAEPSDVIGLYETLAGIDFEFNARAKQSGFVLRISREDLLDLLGQHPALLPQLFKVLWSSTLRSDHAD